MSRIHPCSIAPLRPRQTGRPFTLFELVLVLALLALLLGMAVPVLRGFLRGRATVEEARCLLAYSRHAASEAICRGEIWELWLDPAKRMYGVEARSDLKGAGQCPAPRQLPETILLSTVVEGVETSEACLITWYPDGGMDATGLDAVIVASSHDGSDVIELVPDDAGTGLALGSDDRVEGDR